MKIGDLVKMTKYSRSQLEFPPIGFGCITKIVGTRRSSGRDIVYVTWYEDGITRPINTLWIERV